MYWFGLSKNAIKEWDINQNSKYNKLISTNKSNMVKYWIRCKVPLFVREHRLKTYGMYCETCGQLINTK